MPEFNFSWTEPLQISVVHYEQHEGTVLIRVLWSRIVPALDTALGLVLVSLKWYRCPKIRNLQEFFLSVPVFWVELRVWFFGVGSCAQVHACVTIFAFCLSLGRAWVLLLLPILLWVPISVDIFCSVVELFYTFLLEYIITFLWFQ
jgi:hypothetical protein